MRNVFYTDGACSKNGYEGSAGGYGIVEVNEFNNIVWQYQDFKSPTTNNEMELMAILGALNRIKEYPIDFLKPIIYTDSAYCCNLINDWMYKWKKNGWTRGKGQEVKNLEIIKQIYELAHLAEIRKVPGHSGLEWNEYADKLATGKIKID